MAENKSENHSQEQEIVVFDKDIGELILDKMHEKGWTLYRGSLLGHQVDIGKLISQGPVSEIKENEAYSIYPRLDHFGRYGGDKNPEKVLDASRGIMPQIYFGINVMFTAGLKLNLYPESIWLPSKMPILFRSFELLHEYVEINNAMIVHGKGVSRINAIDKYYKKMKAKEIPEQTESRVLLSYPKFIVGLDALPNLHEILGEEIIMPYNS